MPTMSGTDTTTTKWSQKFKKDDVIRNKITGHAFLVVHVYRPICLLVIDLEDGSNAPVPHVILPRQVEDYALDEDMEYSETRHVWKSLQLSL